MITGTGISPTISPRASLELPRGTPERVIIPFRTEGAAVIGTKVLGSPKETAKTGLIDRVKVLDTEPEALYGLDGLSDLFATEKTSKKADKDAKKTSKSGSETEDIETTTSFDVEVEPEGAVSEIDEKEAVDGKDGVDETDDVEESDEIDDDKDLDKAAHKKVSLLGTISSVALIVLGIFGAVFAGISYAISTALVSGSISALAFAGGGYLLYRNVFQKN